MSILGLLTRKLVDKAVKYLPLRPITRGGDEAPYLDRYYVIGKPPVNFPSELKPQLGWLPFTVFLHHFLASDEEEELHNHPWDVSYSLILAGGYREERKLEFESKTAWYQYRAGNINTLSSNDFHRVVLTEKDAWTLFITGKKTQSWEFWSPKKDEYVNWKEYRAWKAKQDATPGCGKFGCVSPEPDHYHPPRGTRMYRIGTAWLATEGAKESYGIFSAGAKTRSPWFSLLECLAMRDMEALETEDSGTVYNMVPVPNAEYIPFDPTHFDVVTVADGL